MDNSLTIPAISSRLSGILPDRAPYMPSSGYTPHHYIAFLSIPERGKWRNGGKRDPSTHYPADVLDAGPWIHALADMSRRLPGRRERQLGQGGQDGVYPSTSLGTSPAIGRAGMTRLQQTGDCKNRKRETIFFSSINCQRQVDLYCQPRA